MIRIYYHNRNNKSYWCALNWFKRYGIEVEKKHISKLSRADLIKLLSFTDWGIDEVVKRSNKCSEKVRDEIEYMKGMTFDQAIEFLISHPSVFQTPIIFEEKNYMIGYNEQEIRKFFPKSYRFRKHTRK